MSNEVTELRFFVTINNGLVSLYAVLASFIHLKYLFFNDGLNCIYLYFYDSKGVEVVYF